MTRRWWIESWELGRPGRSALGRLRGGSRARHLAAQHHVVEGDAITLDLGQDFVSKSILLVSSLSPERHVSLRVGVERVAGTGSRGTCPRASPGAHPRSRVAVMGRIALACRENLVHLLCVRRAPGERTGEPLAVLCEVRALVPGDECVKVVRHHWHSAVVDQCLDRLGGEQGWVTIQTLLRGVALLVRQGQKRLEAAVGNRRTDSIPVETGRPAEGERAVQVVG